MQSAQYSKSSNEIKNYVKQSHVPSHDKLCKTELKKKAQDQFIQFYSQHREEYISDKKLFDNWIKKLHNLRDMTSDYVFIPTERTLKNWLYQFKKNQNCFQIKKRAQRGKINEEVLQLLITTIMDYPQWSGKKRAEYLNFESGIFESGKGISLRSVNRIISQLNFQIKSIKFTPPARNTIGLMILRAF